MILFISGTDTGVGKTWVSGAIIRALIRKSARVMPVKPVATGAIFRNGERRSADALSLMRAAGTPRSAYKDVNPCLFRPPISPHLAARRARAAISFRAIQRHIYNMEKRSDVVVVEGVGGVATPLTDTQTWADLMSSFNTPSTGLVCSGRVGTLSHTLMSLEYLRTRGIRCAFLAIGSYDAADIRHRENRRELKRLTGLPVIAQARTSGRLTGDIAVLRSCCLR